MKLTADLNLTMTVETVLGAEFSAAILDRELADEDLSQVVVSMVMSAIGQGFEIVNATPSGAPPTRAAMYPVGAAMVQVIAIQRSEVGVA